MDIKIPRSSGWVRFSPWWIIGAVVILAAVLLVISIKNVHRERAFMEKALLSQAKTLMRSVEAGSRTGMMGMGWGYRQQQLLVEEIAQQSDVLYVALATPEGRVVAHSDPSQVGAILPVSLPEPGKTAQRFMEEEREAFMVAKAYEPWLRQRGGGSWEMCSFNNYGPVKNLFIVVGLDPTPFEEAQQQDFRQMALLSVTLFLVGGAGLLSLFWAQSYRSARSSLQDMRVFTSTIINQMPVGLLATDEAGQIRKTNDAARTILKCADRLDGSIADLSFFSPLVEQLKREERISEREVLCPINGTERVPILVSAAVLRDGEDKKVGEVLLFTDITAIKELEERLRRSERLAGLGKLAAGIAHEIRNPLSSIKGFATILGGRYKHDEGSRKLTEVMVSEVERLNRVVTELLEYARPTELQKRLISVKEIAESSLRLISEDAGRQGISIELSEVREDLQIEADPDRFTQVLLNLYLNALQAMKGGGILRITVSREQDHVVWTISDTGAGISPEHLPHVFDPYFTTKPEGVGLGLANVHKLVEAHGGEVRAASTLGAGATFRIVIPGGNGSLPVHSAGSGIEEATR